MLQEILAKWSHDLGELPRNYICFDQETTGTELGDDLVVELGYCHVIDGHATEYCSHVIDWTDVLSVDQDWLKAKLKACDDHMKKRGRTSHMTYERMQKEGSSYEDVLGFYVNLFEIARDSNEFIIGHNLVSFDAPVFEQAVEEWLGMEGWNFPGRVFDTAAVEKATLTGMAPWPNEEMTEYFKRVLGRPAYGVLYNLEKWCVEKYGLLEKYPDLDLTDAHTAGFDAMLVHLLLEEFRELGDLE